MIEEIKKKIKSENRKVAHLAEILWKWLIKKQTTYCRSITYMNRSAIDETHMYRCKYVPQLQDGKRYPVGCRKNLKVQQNISMQR